MGTLNGKLGKHTPIFCNFMNFSKGNLFIGCNCMEKLKSIYFNYILMEFFGWILIFYWNIAIGKILSVFGRRCRWLKADSLDLINLQCQVPSLRVIKIATVKKILFLKLQILWRQFFMIIFAIVRVIIYHWLKSFLTFISQA